MKVIHYLQAKYRQRYPTTCKRFEAKILGIPYPLETGWLLRYGDAELDSDKLSALERGLRRVRMGGAPGAQWAEEGLKVIKRAQIIDRSLAITGDGIPYQTVDWDRAVRSVVGLSRRACGACGEEVAEPVIKHRLDIPALFLDFDNLILLCTPCGEWWDEQPRNQQGQLTRSSSKTLMAMIKFNRDIKSQDFGPHQPAEPGKVVAANAGCGWIKQSNGSNSYDNLIDSCADSGAPATIPVSGRTPEKPAVGGINGAARVAPCPEVRDERCPAFAGTGAGP